MSCINMDKVLHEIETLDGSATFGIDGMVDEVWELVARRKNDTEYQKIQKLAEFGNVIVESGTGGVARERLLKRRSNGGFVCNTGRAIATLGVDTTFLGMFGEEPYDDIFDEFKDIATLISVGEPARIHVIEFSDGKIFMPHLDNLIKIKWADICTKLGDDYMEQIFDKDIIGVGYWSNLYDFENIVNGICAYALQNGRTKRIFHDFANLAKRTSEALLEALDFVAKKNEILPQTLSLNANEGRMLAQELGIAYDKDIANAKDSEDAVLEIAKLIREKIKIDEVIIHTTYYTVIATAKDGAASCRQNVCAQPVKTTGAGDTFNGGYMASCLMDLTPAERLLVSNATTLYYVSNGKAATKEQLMGSVKTFQV